MLQIWDEDWPLDENVCPCDLLFIEWLQKERIAGKSIFHFGTGGHHIVGLDNMRRGAPNTILGITAAPKEQAHFVKLAIEHAELSRSYQSIFGDIYLLNPKLMPAIDIATAFHLSEFRNEHQDTYGGLTDRQVMERLVDMLPAGGRVLLYSGSYAYWLAQSIARSMALDGRIRHAETFKTIEVYEKVG